MPSSLISSKPFFIRAQNNHTYHNILLDTGSSITVIHNRFLQCIYHNTFEPSQNSYISANCTTSNIIGKVQLEIKINGLSTFVTASVASSLVTDVLVGTDWLNQYVLCLDISTRRLTLQDNTGQITTTSLIQSNNTSCCTVRLPNQITIPQYSESIITATVHLPNSSNLLFEPSSSFNQKATVLPTALIHKWVDTNTICTDTNVSVRVHGHVPKCINLCPKQLASKTTHHLLSPSTGPM